MSHEIAKRVSAAAADDGWVRASRCTPGNNCVELRFGCGVIDVRDSKNVDSEVLTFESGRWIGFLERVVR